MSGDESSDMDDDGLGTIQEGEEDSKFVLVISVWQKVCVSDHTVSDSKFVLVISVWQKVCVSDHTVSDSKFVLVISVWQKVCVSDHTVSVTVSLC